jgi:hypothetical protein
MSKNNTYDVKCPNCGQFISHQCQIRTIYGLDRGYMVILYRCGGCKNYQPFRSFPKDKTKKYGIRNVCRKCRSLQGNGN